VQSRKTEYGKCDLRRLSGVGGALSFIWHPNHATTGKWQTVNSVLDVPSLAGQGSLRRHTPGNDRPDVCRLQVARREARTSTRPGGSPKRLQPERARCVVAGPLINQFDMHDQVAATESGSGTAPVMAAV
jgi:hypothetical protein